MRRTQYTLCLLLVLALGAAAGAQSNKSRGAPGPDYAIAFASFAPLNTDIFIAAADGSDAKPFLAHPDLDYNASFSPDGRWIVFTSTRNGSADIYRVRPDGAELRRLTDDPAFDDQGALSPDGRSLAFVSSRSGQADIWILELATRRASQSDEPSRRRLPSVLVAGRPVDRLLVRPGFEETGLRVSRRCSPPRSILCGPMVRTCDGSRIGMRSPEAPRGRQTESGWCTTRRGWTRS